MPSNAEHPRHRGPLKLKNQRQLPLKITAKRVTKRANFVSPNEKAKSAVVAQFVRIARKARLGYDDFLYISQQARKKLGLRRGHQRPLWKIALGGSGQGS